MSTPDDFRDPPSCRPVQPAAPRRSQEPFWDPGIASLTIEGIECRQCATRIRNALLENKAVLGAEADGEEGVVDVLFDRTRLTLDDLADVIASAADHPGRSYRVTW